MKTKVRNKGTNFKKIKDMKNMSKKRKEIGKL